MAKQYRKEVGFETGSCEEDWVVVPCNERSNMFSSSVMDELVAGEDLKVEFYRPADYWTDALPVGNGRLGAMVWGGVQQELLQLNEDTLWTGEPSDYTDPRVATVLPQVRKLVTDGKFAEASTAAEAMIGQPTEVYQPLGDIKIDFCASHKDFDADSYTRELDLDTATVTVKYVAEGIEFTREVFSSYPYQIIATKISANKLGAVSFTVALDSPLQYESHINGKNQIIMQGECPGMRAPPQKKLHANRQGIKFCAILELHISSDAGIVSSIEDKQLRVEGSNWAVLLLAASSSYDGPFTSPAESKKDPVFASLATLNSIKDVSFSELYASHLADYQQLFHRVSLQLSNSTKSSSQNNENLPLKNMFQGMPCADKQQKLFAGKISTADRINNFTKDEDPSLLTLLFQYGRYLMISSSRPGTLVSNLQGIWSENLAPRWDASPHLNINLQMNYWPAISCNLAECQEPLFDLISNLSINGRKTSQVNYKTGGWVTHHVTDIWAKTSASEGNPKHAVWPMGGAWLCTHLWEHYSYTLDKVAETRFASNTIALRRLVKVREALSSMVISNNWSIWRQSSAEKATKIKSMILDDSWWDRVEYLLSFTKPILSMIRYTDMDKPCIGEIYDGIDSMLEKIKSIINAKEQDPEETFFKQVHAIVEERWNKMTTPLHLLAFALTPKYYSSQILSTPGRLAPYRDLEVAAGYKAAFARLFPNPDLRSVVTSEFIDFVHSNGLDIDALRDRFLKDAHSWWYFHGQYFQNLRPLAIKVLSQSFLEQKAYPLLKGCAEFLLDWLVEYPKSVLVTNPATSPEHLFIAPDGQMASVSYATAMDMAIIKEIFIATISAAKVLGNTSDDLIQKMKAALTNLFRPKVARDGSLMEWAQDFQDPEVQHRHMSHLFGLYPGHTITMESTPELCKAAINSLFKRGEDGPGWSTVWKIALWARLHDSDHAYRMVKKLITLVNPTNEERFKGELYANLFEGGLYANLFTAHPPFQIDANFGFASAIAEILIQSDEKNLFLLPALPRDKWPSGCVSGLKARGHTNVAICWREGELHEVGLVVHNHSSPKNLHYNGMSVTVELSVGYVHTFNGDLKMVRSLPLLGIKKMSQSSCSIS